MNTPKGSLGPLRFCIPSSEDYVLTSVTVVQPVLDHHIKSIIHYILLYLGKGKCAYSWNVDPKITPWLMYSLSHKDA